LSKLWSEVFESSPRHQAYMTGVQPWALGRRRLPHLGGQGMMGGGGLLSAALRHAPPTSPTAAHRL
jgi:hypothetical protein